MTDSTGIYLYGDRTLYAHWNRICTVTLVYQDGVTENKTLTTTASKSELKLGSPSRSGYQFQGWYDASTGGAKVSDYWYTPTNDCTLYAHWSRNGVDVTDEKSYTVAATGYTWHFVIDDNGLVTITYVSPSPSGALEIPMTVRDDTSGATAVVTGIGSSAFQGESGLTAVAFPATLTYIGDYAFSETGLKNVTIPATVTNFSLNAFDSCKQLETLTIAAKTISSDCSLDLCDCPKLTTLNLPDSIDGVVWNLSVTPRRICRGDFPITVERVNCRVRQRP